MTAPTSAFVPLALLALVAMTAPPAARGAESGNALPWTPEQCRAILDKTLTLRLAPDLSGLDPGEKAAVAELLSVGQIMEDVYEDSLHPQALAARRKLEEPGARQDLATLYRLFRGPIATTLDNHRAPFLAVEPETPGKNVYPWGISAEEVKAYVAAHPEQEAAILGERTVVRRATAENLARDVAALDRHPALAVLLPDLAGALRKLTEHPDPKTLYAVPYSVAWADELGRAQLALFRAADDLQGSDPEFAGYLRDRGRDLLSNDYESGDASWVTGHFGKLNAQIGAYETYDDALFSVKAFHSFSLLLRDEKATEELHRGLGDLQQVEDALPYQPHKRVRTDIPVGVYEVIADFGQARGTNTASILPNDSLYARRYGRTILLRENIMENPQLAELARRRWEAAMAPEFAGDFGVEGGFQRTLWHEVGHYLGPDRTSDGRDLSQALQDFSNTLEEMKADLVSLFAMQHFADAGLASPERLRAVQASGILRTLQNDRPRRDQPYQTMQLAQFNWFLDRGLLTVGADGRLSVHYEKYAPTVTALLEKIFALQQGGDPRAAAAFFERWTTWTPELHEKLAARLREAEGPRFRLVRYAALGE
jgi:hypothetical protein